MFYSKDGIYNSTSGTYTGNASTTFSQNPQSSNYSGGTYTGTWFQWQFFEKVKVSQLRIAGNSLSHRDRSPGKGVDYLVVMMVPFGIHLAMNQILDGLTMKELQM